MKMPVKTVLAACVVAMLLANATLHAGESVAEARELYASAAYVDALKMLDDLLAGNHTREERQSIGLYRVLCLVALGRTADVERAIETLILQDPLYRPSVDDVSPRIRTAFSDARRRLLPSIIQQQYTDAKAAFERQQFEQAARAFKEVLDQLADPDVGAAASQLPLSDLRTLAAGFYDLSAKASAPPPPLPPVVAAPPAPVRDFRRVFTAEESEVVPPTVIRQALPPFRGMVSATMTGAIEILIGPSGEVESAVMRAPVHPLYDRTVLSAARKWQYQPATLEGVPVRFVKRVQISLSPGQ